MPTLVVTGPRPEHSATFSCPGSEILVKPVDEDEIRLMRLLKSPRTNLKSTSPEHCRGLALTPQVRSWIADGRLSSRASLVSGSGLEREHSVGLFPGCNAFPCDPTAPGGVGAHTSDGDVPPSGGSGAEAADAAGRVHTRSSCGA